MASSFANMLDYYHILSVSKEAAEAEIKSAYRRLAVLYHPDKNGGSKQHEEAFKLINEAYQVLSDPQKKEAYDQILLANLLNRYAQKLADENKAAGSQHPNRSKREFRRQAAKAVYQEPMSHPKAIGMAFALVAGFFFFIVGLFSIVGGIEESHLQNRAIQTAGLLREIDFSASTGDYAHAFKIIENLKLTEFYVLAFDFSKASLLEKMAVDAEKQYADKNYEKSYQMFSELEGRSKNVEREWVFKKGLCLKNIGRELEALAVFEKLASDEKENFRLFTTIADIYMEAGEAPNTITALENYDKACNILAKKYTDDYGDAYYLMIFPENIPVSHYDAYTGKARALYESGRYEEAAKTCQWARFLKPGLGYAYLMEAECLYRLRRSDEACRLLKEGKANVKEEYKGFPRAWECRE